MKDAIQKSWKTTAAGVLTFLGALFGALAAILDADPLTVPDWSLVGVAFMAMVGLLLARDNDKSSEGAGAR